MTAQLTIDQTTGFLALPDGDEISGGGAVIARDVVPDPSAIADEVLLYIYSDQNPDDAQKDSRIYARLNDAFYGMIMPRDFMAAMAQAGLISSGTTLPDNSTEGILYIYDDPTEQDSRVFVKFTQGWTALLMPQDFEGSAQSAVDFAEHIANGELHLTQTQINAISAASVDFTAPTNQAIGVRGLMSALPQLPADRMADEYAIKTDGTLYEIPKPPDPVSVAASRSNFGAGGINVWRTVGAWNAGANRQGTALNETTGVFTAPVAGLFSITFGCTYQGWLSSGGSFGATESFTIRILDGNNQVLKQRVISVTANGSVDALAELNLTIWLPENETFSFQYFIGITWNTGQRSRIDNANAQINLAVVDLAPLEARIAALETP